MPNWCCNVLTVTGKEEEVLAFKLKARGHRQNYNDFHRNESWEVFDDIRLKALVSTPPPLGDVVDLSFHALVPVPDDVMAFPYDDGSAIKVGEKLGMKREYGGYSWEVNNWGCKWGGCDTNLDEEDFSDKNYSSVQYSFQTAWAPPTAWLEKVSELFPSLDFFLSFEEPGMAFQGELAYLDGSVYHEIHEEMEDYDDYEEE